MKAAQMTTAYFMNRGYYYSVGYSSWLPSEKYGDA